MCKIPEHTAGKILKFPLDEWRGICYYNNANGNYYYYGGDAMAMQKKSRKRDAILACVCSTDTHPTAEWVYTRLKPEIPDLSL